MISALLALALATDVQSETVRSGSVRDRVVVDDADLVIFYASEHDGELGTCGCESNPRGGLARLGGYLEAVERWGPGTPSLRVHVGRWASDRIGETLDLRPDARVRNSAMVRAIETLGFDALNLSFRDSPWLRTNPAPSTVVSVNAARHIPAVELVDVAGRTVALTGVSRAGSPYVQPEGFDWIDPVDALEEALGQWAEQADLVVVLAYETRDQTERIARLDGVDVVIEAGRYGGRQEPWTERGSVWVQSRDEGQAVGELRIWLDADGISAVHDRWVDLDDAVPELAPIRKLERRTERERLRALRDAGLAE